MTAVARLSQRAVFDGDIVILITPALDMSRLCSKKKLEAALDFCLRFRFWSFRIF
jgi:hypothetical protein